MAIGISRSWTLRISLLLGASLAGYPAGASAQSAPVNDASGEAVQSAASEAATPRQGGIEDIIVTARKRVENVQNVPVAATVVSPEQLDRLAINSVEKLAVLAPQLIIGRNGSGNGGSIALRGISVNTSSISLEQSVATIIDGVYYGSGRALNLGLFDVERVEVLKGPQSLFYGKNTTAGAISVKTADPERSFSAMVKGGYEFNSRQPYFQAYVTGPVTDTLALRLTGGVSKQYGALIRNVTTGGIVNTPDVATGIVTAHTFGTNESDMPGERSIYVRGSAQWRPLDDLSATLKLQYNDYRTNSPNSSIVVAVCESGRAQNDPAAACGRRFRTTQGALPPDIAATNPLLNGNGGKTFLHYQAYVASSEIVYDPGFVTISVTPGFTHTINRYVGDFDFSENGLSRPPALGSTTNQSGSRETNEAASVEARAQTHFDGMLNIMVGSYYQHFRQRLSSPAILAGTRENSAASPENRYVTVNRRSSTIGKTYAGFAQLLLDITPSLNVSGGVRYTHETKNSDLNQFYVNPASTYALVRFMRDQSFDNTSPEATVTWKPDSNVTVYGSYRTGYKSGGYSISAFLTRNSTADDPAYGNETVEGFEAGVKSTLFDRQLRLNADVYRYTYDGLQIDYVDPRTAQNFTQNAAKARTQGVEVDGEVALRNFPGFVIRASGAYTDAKYLSFPLAPCNGGQRPVEGCNLAVNPTTGAGTRQDLSGQRLPAAPSWTGNVGADYTFDVGAARQIYLNGNMRFSSRYKLFGYAPDHADRFFQKAYATFDASVGYGPEDRSWQVQLVGKNLTNRFVAMTGSDTAGSGSNTGVANGVHSDTRVSVADPRTVSIELTARF